jgi:transposase InsO family protein
VWHSRLGHSSFVTVSNVIKIHHLPVLSDAPLNKPFFCDSCQVGKGKQQPFSSSNRISSAPLKLIHTDIWTSPITSLSGCKYYIIFVDDFSRYTWFYPLHTKSKAYDCFVKYKTLVETQFSCKLKSLQSDGRGKYTSLRFQNFLSKHGILHRKSCPYTSQQNGLAERKLRHLLETGLTLLAHSGLSNKFWVEAFLTSTFIINRLPTVVLHHTSPFQKLFNTVPDYKAFRVFGCKCFPLLRPYTTHKLEFRSKPCIFLGYSHAGYRCLDPFTNKVYLSRNVVFNESSFPTKDHGQLQLPSKINASADLPFPLLVSYPIPPPLSTAQQNFGSPTHSSTASIELVVHPVAPSSNSTKVTSTTLPHMSPNLSVAPAVQPIEIVVKSPIESSPSSTESTPSSHDIIQSPLSPPHHPMVTRSHTGSLKTKSFSEFKLYYNSRYPPIALNTSLSISEPTCYSKAANDPR